MSGAGGSGHVRERAALAVAEHHVGHERGIGGRARAEIEVQEAVVVEVAEVRAHGRDHALEAHRPRHVLEPAPRVAVELHALGLGGQAQVEARHLRDRRHEAGHEEVEPAVVVVVPEPGREAHDRPLHAELARALAEGAVALVVIEEVLAPEVRHVQVRPAVAVVIAPGRALGEGLGVDAGRVGDVLEGAVPTVAEERGRALFVADEEVEPAVVVVIGPDRGMGATDGAAEARLGGDVGERPVAVVAQQGVAHRELPAAAHHEEVEPAVVVVVGLHDVDAADVAAQAGRRRAVLERPVAAAMVVAQRRTSLQELRAQMLFIICGRNRRQGGQTKCH